MNCLWHSTDDLNAVRSVTQFFLLVDNVNSDPHRFVPEISKLVLFKNTK
jgi:hypothetical protein